LLSYTLANIFLALAYFKFSCTLLDYSCQCQTISRRTDPTYLHG
jgi:hypothetical protein